MKEIIIIFVILIIIFGAAFYSQKFLNNTSDLLVSKLENLKYEIEKKNITNEKIKVKADDICVEWKDIGGKWSIIVLHDEVDLIETALIKMRSKIKTDKMQESIEDLDTIIFLLKNVKGKGEINLKNIF